MSASYLVEILLPKEAGNGEPVLKDWFEDSSGRADG